LPLDFSKAIKRAHLMADDFPSRKKG